MYNEQRTHKRVSFFLLDKGKQPVWAFPLNKGSIAGIILDFSPFGGRLLLPPQAKLQREELTITLHNTTEKNDSCIEIQAKVLWHKKQPTSNNTEVGCQFINTTKEATLKLMNLIAVAKKQTRQLIVRCELGYL